MTADAAVEVQNPDTRTTLLDAAERIVVSQGVARMTLEEVAREAGVSKGGLLYHFRSKDALTQGMIERFVGRFDAAVTLAHDGDAEPTGRWIRAYVRATAGQTPLTGEEFDRANGALTAALANFPERLEAVREQSLRHQAEIEGDTLDPVFATIIRFAIDGIWLGQNFDLIHLDPRMKAAVIDRLLAWTRLDDLPGPGGGRPSPNEAEP